MMYAATILLDAIESRMELATDELLPAAYDELKRLASRKLARERPGRTLQTTALVNETYVRLVGSRGADDDRRAEWSSRGHFFAAAAEAMRRILIDSARRKRRLKRGGDRHAVELDDVALAVEARSEELIALDEAVDRLESHDEMKAAIVKLRYFAGMTIEETAAALGVSEPTVKRHWSYARAWLRRAMSEGVES